MSFFCSLVVTSSAVLLKPYQEVNRKLERMVQLVRAAGIEAQKEKALPLFEAHIKAALLDLEQDRLVDPQPLGIDPVTF